MAIPFFGKKTDTQSTDQIRRYESELKAAGNYHQEHFWRRAERMVQLYELNHYGTQGSVVVGGLADHDRIKVPYPYANTRQILAEIYIKTPEPIVRPSKKNMTVNSTVTGQPVQVDLVAGATKMKSALEYIVRESNLKHEAKLAVLDGVVTGVGCLMISAQKNSKVPKYKRIVYRDVLYSIDCDYPYQSPWITRRIIRPLEDVQNDESYDKTARATVKANYKLDSSITQEMNDYFKQFSYVVLWDRWDKQRDAHCVWADGSTDFLVEETISEIYQFKVENDEYKIDWPFCFFMNEEMISKPFGMGDIAPIESQVRELDKTRTQQINHRKRFNRKYMMKKGFLDSQGVEQFKNPADGTLVETIMDILPSNFQPIQDAPMSADVYRVEDAIQRDIQTISPIGPNSLVRGVGQGPGTLGEAEIINQNTDTRLDEKRDNVAEFFARIFRLTAQFVQQYWIEEDVMLVSGDGQKDTDWLNYTPDEIQGEYNYTVDPETLRDNDAVYRKQASDALTTAVPILMQLGYPQGIALLLKKYLETFEWKDLDSIVPPQFTETPLDSGATTDPHADLMNLIGSSDPNQVVDSLQGLPDNLRATITDSIKTAVSQPSNSAMTGSALNVRR